MRKVENVFAPPVQKCQQVEEILGDRRFDIDVLDFAEYREGRFSDAEREADRVVRVLDLGEVV